MSNHTESNASKPEAADGVQSMKTPADHFTDWEAHVFGFGYGTGEEHTVPALRQFFELVPVDGAYEYGVLERALGPVVAWLLINALCRADIIEYGTSPRFAWLTPQGKALQAFVLSKSAGELTDLTSRDNDYAYCYPDGCNCGPQGYEEGRRCGNPFWRESA